MKGVEPDVDENRDIAAVPDPGRLHVAVCRVRGQESSASEQGELGTK